MEDFRDVIGMLIIIVGGSVLWKTATGYSDREPTRADSVMTWALLGAAVLWIVSDA